MLYKEILDVINKLLPTLSILFVVIVSLRISDILINKKKVNIVNEVISLTFLVYILMLFQVVTFQDVSYGTANYIPFKEMFRYDIGTRLFYKNVVGNLLMFLPYGFFVTYYLKTKKFHLVLILSTILSVSIEFTQKNIGRTFDIDDIILNIIGGIGGYLIYLLVNRIVKVIKVKHE